MTRATPGGPCRRARGTRGWIWTSGAVIGADVIVRRPALGDFSRAAALVCAHLGPAYVSTAELEDLERDGVVLVAANGPHVIGVGTGVALSRRPDALCGIEVPGREVGVVKSLVVDDRWRGRGVGGLLLDAVTGELAAQGHDVLASMSWVKETDGSGGLFVARGWRLDRRVERAWYDASVREGFSCPVCGNPCVCAADVYVKQP